MTFTGYCDLQFSPATYDVVATYSAFELERRKQADQAMRIVFLPGPNRGFRRDKFWPESIAMRETMRDRVAVPMAHMMPTTSVEVLKVRPQGPEKNSIGFGHSHYGLRLHIQALRQGIRPLRVALAPRRDRNIVTITLREAEHWPERNSKIPAWLTAAEWIEKEGFAVVVVRDTMRAHAQFGDFEIAPGASLELDERAKLYSRAACNLFVNNGPAWFAMALDAPVLMLKPTVEGLMRTCSGQYFEQCGLKPGTQIDSNVPHQRIAWCDDTPVNILKAFDEFMVANSERQREVA